MSEYESNALKEDKARGKIKTLSPSGRAAAGRTKQSRRDISPISSGSVDNPRSLPFEEISPGVYDKKWEEQNKRGNRGSGTNKLWGGLRIPAIAKARPAFTEVERPPMMKAGGPVKSYRGYGKARIPS